VSNLFRIEILEQSWFKDSSPSEDPCSHGRIKLRVGDKTVASGEEEYGISVSALALLKTLDSNHNRKNQVADRLILHGCAQLLMAHCPIGIDWSVTHLEGGRIRIADVVRYDTTRESEAVCFPRLSVEIPEEIYRAQVLSFARKAKQLFAGVEKTFYGTLEKREYEDFWREYEEQLSRYSV